ncbi:cytochrome c oxidase subunit 4 [Streptomyces sp. WAC06614]|uniref:aa3-type cytochrome oxidase subunit IV n=1 Tax=Streptomyces sp. WAC06614 TaxID=2487416 RepID=UPI000F786DF4|nr:cytochrome c oxidase subunit 4 [Streptomyces sp. WAC06614]RSS78749.1 cytochrome c oxidase subunit 4 [Streptomyces sp. WAC06614]
MRAEAWLFTGVALFFAVTGGVYAAFSSDPAGIAALMVSLLMSGLVALFLWRQAGRAGPRPEDDPTAEVAAAGGRRFFFPARSLAPVCTAAGTALVGVGVAQGLWLALIGFGVLAPGVYGFVFRGGEWSG